MEDYRNNSNGVDKFINTVRKMIKKNTEYRGEELELLLEVLRAEYNWNVNRQMVIPTSDLNEMLGRIMADIPKRLEDYESDESENPFDIAEPEYESKDPYDIAESEYKAALDKIRKEIQSPGKHPKLNDIVFNEKMEFDKKFSSLMEHLKSLQNLSIAVSTENYQVRDNISNETIIGRAHGKNIYPLEAVKGILSGAKLKGKLPDLAKEIANADEVTRNYNTKEER